MYEILLILHSLVTREHPVSHASSRLLVLRFPTAQPIPFRHVITNVLQWGMHRYRLDARGSGCLFWCMNFLYRLEQAGYIRPGSYNHAMASVTAYRYTAQGSYWIPDDAGTFY